MMKRFECLTDEKVVGFGVDMEKGILYITSTAFSACVQFIR